MIKRQARIIRGSYFDNLGPPILWFREAQNASVFAVHRPRMWFDGSVLYTPPKISERKFIQFTVGDLDKIHILGRLSGYVLSW
jgi:hypothetical protein